MSLTRILVRLNDHVYQRTMSDDSKRDSHDDKNVNVNNTR